MLSVILVAAGCSSAQLQLPANAATSTSGAPLLAQHTVPPERLAGLALDLPETGAAAPQAIARRAASVFDAVRVWGDTPFALDSLSTLDSAEHSAVFQPAAGQLAWAVYQFPDMSGKTYDFFEYCVSQASAQTLYIGLANYQRLTWDWFSAELPDLSSDTKILQQSLEPTADYLSPSGSIYVVLCCWDGASCRLRYCDLYLDVQNVYVNNLDATDGSAADQISISWDATPAASGYQLLYRIAATPDPLLLLAEVSGGATTSFSHTLTEPVGMEAVAGVVYQYWIMAVFSDGSTSRLSGWDTGYCGALP